MLVIIPQTLQDSTWYAPQTRQDITTLAGMLVVTPQTQHCSNIDLHFTNFVACSPLKQQQQNQPEPLQMQINEENTKTAILVFILTLQPATSTQN